MESMRGRPFALIGVNSDADLERVRRVARDKDITWRSFWNGEEGTRGPISSLWNVRRWPTLYVIDHHGVIRATTPRGAELDTMLHRLVADAEADAGKR
ncbi:MAG: hypothetical protein KDC38_10460 [Planctomycetes bacterium]|nr:hypothetical protein [Planctomycetota bacterium]